MSVPQRYDTRVQEFPMCHLASRVVDWVICNPLARKVAPLSMQAREAALPGGGRCGLSGAPLPQLSLLISRCIG